MDVDLRQHHVRPSRAQRGTPEMREFAETLLQKVGLAAFRKKFPSSFRAACSGAPSLPRSMIKQAERS